MGFLDNNTDLTNTIFTQEEWEFARQYLTSKITQIEPSWLQKPTGCLGGYWNFDGMSPVSFLIELALLISWLEQHVTLRSKRILQVKLKQLLREKSQKAFSELLTEFQVEALITQRTSPIEIDPMVPQALLDAHNRPSSPDFAIRLHSDVIFIEVTVFHFGILDRWDEITGDVTSSFAKQLVNKNLWRDIFLEFPLQFQASEIPRDEMGKLIREISNVDKGNYSLPIGGYSVPVRWQPIPHFSNEEQFQKATLKPVGSTIGDSFKSSIAVQYGLMRDDSLDLLLKSLRNTLNLKRKQFSFAAPYLLVVRIGHHRINPDALVQLLYERIWPNSDYRWITGLCLFSPHEKFNGLNPNVGIHLYSNPKAQYPVTPNLHAMFDGKAQFHRWR